MRLLNSMNDEYHEQRSSDYRINVWYPVHISDEWRTILDNVVEVLSETNGWDRFFLKKAHTLTYSHHTFLCTPWVTRIAGRSNAQFDPSPYFLQIDWKGWRSACSVIKLYAFAFEITIVPLSVSWWEEWWAQGGVWWLCSERKNNNNMHNWRKYGGNKNTKYKYVIYNYSRIHLNCREWHFVVHEGRFSARYEIRHSSHECLQSSCARVSTIHTGPGKA